MMLPSAIALSVIALVVILLIIFLFRRIMLASAVIMVASRYPCTLSFYRLGGSLRCADLESRSPRDGRCGAHPSSVRSLPLLFLVPFVKMLLLVATTAWVLFTLMCVDRPAALAAPHSARGCVASNTRGGGTTRTTARGRLRSNLASAGDVTTLAVRGTPVVLKSDKYDDARCLHPRARWDRAPD